MGTIGKNQYDFFVYKHFGIHQERIILNPEIYSSKIVLQKLQAPPGSIALHDQAQTQPDKSKIYTNKK